MLDTWITDTMVDVLELLARAKRAVHTDAIVAEIGRQCPRLTLREALNQLAELGWVHKTTPPKITMLPFWWLTQPGWTAIKALRATSAPSPHPSPSAPPHTTVTPGRGASPRGTSTTTGNWHQAGRPPDDTWITPAMAIVLDVLATAGRPLPTPKIIDEAHRSRGSVVHALDQVVKRGWATKTPPASKAHPAYYELRREALPGHQSRQSGFRVRGIWISPAAIDTITRLAEAPYPLPTPHIVQTVNHPERTVKDLLSRLVRSGWARKTSNAGLAWYQLLPAGRRGVAEMRAELKRRAEPEASPPP